MNYQTLVEDFARRTRENLRHIRQLKNCGAEVYEVTALVNSLLGLLIFPQQRYFLTIPETPIADLERQGWPIPRVIAGFSQVSDLRQLIRMLRNAISHSNLEFIPDSSGELERVVVWNDDKYGATNWKAEMTVSDLDTFAHQFIAQILQESTAQSP